MQTNFYEDWFMQIPNGGCTDTSIFFQNKESRLKLYTAAPYFPLDHETSRPGTKVISKLPVESMLCVRSERQRPSIEIDSFNN
jgi:hypothetical protein